MLAALTATITDWLQGYLEYTQGLLDTLTPFFPLIIPEHLTWVRLVAWVQKGIRHISTFEEVTGGQVDLKKKIH